MGPKNNTTRRVRPTWIFAVLGLLLSVIAALVTSKSSKEFLGDALLTLAFVLLTVVVIQLLWGALGGEPIETALDNLRDANTLLEQSWRTGLRGVVPISNDLCTYEGWMKLLRGAKSDVDLMGYTLMIWTQGHGFEDAVIALVRSGRSFRVLVMDDGHPQFAGSLEPGGLPLPTSKESTIANLQTALNAFGSIQRKLEREGDVSGGFEMRKVKRGTNKCHLCRIDERMLVVHYL